MTMITEILELYRKECFSCGSHRSVGDTTAAEVALTELVNESYSAGYSFAKNEESLVNEAVEALSE
tara:strand:- start:327 stop:524 length:198 start_codon:yes stop_codon:yes gene_type:complete